MTEIPSTAQVLELYKTMLLIRAFDEHAGEARRDGRLRGSVHEYIGEEAIATGVCANLQRTDYISSYHRGRTGTASRKGRTRKRCGDRRGSDRAPVASGAVV